MINRDLKIETNIAIKYMNHLESIIGECLCYSKYKELESKIWNAIDSKNTKEIRRNRFEIEQIIDDLEND